MLTKRETDVLLLLAQGFTNKEIAKNLGISESTVQNHVHNIYCELNIKNRTQAAIYVIQAGLSKNNNSEK
jgi:DNA-binding NarL/FixJ family response regulator